ncbi:hypothetical protein BJ741DRAFT_651880 [Chytriomyces cf. hyalinus JEL632]|nr:hypothetical protein BJ741DRAFT_651880 [Chytriomyces cf. hyalinus JEL632]
MALRLLGAVAMQALGSLAVGAKRTIITKRQKTTFFISMDEMASFEEVDLDAKASDSVPISQLHIKQPEPNAPSSTSKDLDSSPPEAAAKPLPPPRMVTHSQTSSHHHPTMLHTPVVDSSPQTISLRAIARTKVEIVHVKIVDTQLPLLVPKILKYVNCEATLRECLRVCWCFMGAAAARLYQNVAVFGAQGHVLIRLLKLLSKAADGETLLDYRKIVRSLNAGDLVLDESEVTPYQSWNLIREVIRRVAPNLERIYLESSDPRFHDPDLINPTTCGLDQRVQFSRLKSLTIGPGCLAFPDSFLVDLIRRCPRDSLTSIRFPGCLQSVSREAMDLIAGRGGKALQDLILTPPSSYPPPLVDDVGGGVSAQAGAKDSSSVTTVVVGGVRGGVSKGSAFKDLYDAQGHWDLDTLCYGISQVVLLCPDLRALDISGHAQGLKPGIVEQLLKTCVLLEELDLPCGVNDSTMSEILLSKPKHLWRINTACCCRKSYLDPTSAAAPATNIGSIKDLNIQGSTSSLSSASSRIPSCSTFTDVIIKAIVEQILPGKLGALLELPTHGMKVQSAKWVPMLKIVEEIGGAKVDFRDTNGVYVPRIGVKIVVPNGRMYM